MAKAMKTAMAMMIVTAKKMESLTLMKKGMGG